MSWRGRGGGWRGQWSGRGPFSHLPPCHRPGWLYGRGACWWHFDPNLRTTIPLASGIQPTLTIPKEQETVVLENQAKYLEQALEQVRKRLEELHSGEKE